MTSPIPVGDSMYAMVVRRIRASVTIFDQRVKLSLRQNDEEQLSRLELPYALVVPVQDRPPGAPVRNDISDLVVPRSVAILAQFDARGSDQEYLAAADIERARYELLDCLVNWRPFRHYDATTFGGLRIEGTKAPNVRAWFLFFFNEVLSFDCAQQEVGCDDAGFDVAFKIQPIDECYDPCAPGSPLAEPRRKA